MTTDGPPAKKTKVDDGTMEATAIARALIIPELFEAILLKLDAKTLLLSQRTSKAFQSAVLSSPQLQKKLFLREAVRSLQLADGEELDQAQVLIENDQGEERQDDEMIMMNPLLFSSANSEWPWQPSFRMSKHGLPGSSCQRMLLTNPQLGVLSVVTDGTDKPAIEGRMVVDTGRDVVQLEDTFRLHEDDLRVDSEDWEGIVITVYGRAVSVSAHLQGVFAGRGGDSESDGASEEDVCGWEEISEADEVEYDEHGRCCWLKDIDMEEKGGSEEEGQR